MEIELKGIGKKFNSNWVFKNLDLTIPQGSGFAITGSNGSGKSTLLKIMGTYSLPTRGIVSFKKNTTPLSADEIQLKMSFVAPYMHLIEELTFSELLQFHAVFRENLIPVMEIPERVQLPPHKHISEFSSGMKQRVKLCLAFFFASDCLLLDEPTSNLDTSGIQWYQEQISSLLGKKTVVIASNIEAEYAFCQAIFRLANLK